MRLKGLLALSAARLAARALSAAAIAVACVSSNAAPELGVYRWDAPTGPANVDGFGQWLGKPVNVATAFEARATWDDIRGAAWQLAPWGQWVGAQPNRNLSLAIPMLPASGASLAGCSAGQYDVYWTSLANELSYYRLHWAYLRLGWEMDGTWYPWTATPGSGRESTYAGCFRRIVQVMRQAQPANQWKFVLNTAANWWNRSYLDAIWPGDAYVDVVAIDLYDQSWKQGTYPYPSTCDSACRLLRQQAAWNDYSWHLYAIRDFAIAHGKKMALPEWGVAILPDGHGGGDNPFYIRKMYEFIQEPLNGVAYHSYWNVSADIDGRLTDSVTGDVPTGGTRFPQSAALFKQLFGATTVTPPPVPAADTTAPAVSLTSPPAGTTIGRRTTVTLEASASDNVAVASVEFTVDGARVCVVQAAPYRCSWNTGSRNARRYTVTAKASDAAGNAASASRTYDSR